MNHNINTVYSLAVAGSLRSHPENRCSSYPVVGIGTSPNVSHSSQFFDLIQIYYKTNSSLFCSMSRYYCQNFTIIFNIVNEISNGLIYIFYVDILRHALNLIIIFYFLRRLKRFRELLIVTNCN